MERLTPRQQQIARCRCIDELSVDETAFALGITGNTVKNHGTGMLLRVGVRSFYGLCREIGWEIGFHAAVKTMPGMRAEKV